MSKINIFSLGGLNEIGKNMYVVEVDNDIFVFDAGLKYADDNMLGIDYIIPNYDYLKNNKERIKGIFITHGHDEQMGALADILPDLKGVNIYGTKFTLSIIKEQLQENKLDIKNLITIKPHKKINFGENSIFPVSLTHNVPDTVGYALYTKDGIIFYTGNFIFDPTMQEAYATDIGKLAYIGKQNVLCLMSESLYADKKGFTSPTHRSDSVIKETLSRTDNRIIFSVSETHFYRIQELFNEIEKVSRNVVILGKRLQNTINDAIENKYLKFNKEKLIGINHINNNNVVVIVSDEREKPFSNLKRIIKGYDKFVKITENDTIIFANPIYDGMEKTVTEIYDGIAKIGANLVLLSSKVKSFHASSEDLMQMISLMNPKYYFPVIGEYRHQVENLNSALKTSIKEENIILRTNGEVATFINGKLDKNIQKVMVDDILIDGKTVGDIGEIVIKDRESLASNGIVIVTVSIDKTTKEIIAGPEILTRGFIYVKDNLELINDAAKLSLQIIKENIKENYVDYNKIKQGIRDKVGKYFYEQTECKPMILIVTQEINLVGSE